MNPVLERQRWLAALALVVVVPLPLAGVVTWPFMAPYLLAALAALSVRRPLRPLSGWTENSLAPLILIAAIAAGGIRFGILRPVAQLALLLATVRLIGCGDSSRSRHTLAVLGLVGVAGVASSTHPALLVHLVVLLAGSVVAYARFNYLARRGGAGLRDFDWRPPKRLIIVTVLLAMMAAAPIFALFPRLRSPFAGGVMGSRAVAGYRGAVSLNRVGEIQLSQARALTVRFSGAGVVQPGWLYLAGSTARYYHGGTWSDSRRGVRVRPSANGLLRLQTQPRSHASSRAEIVLAKPSETLFLPPGTVSLRMPDASPLILDRGGSVRLLTPATVAYEARFVPGTLLQPPPGPEDLELATDLARIVVTTSEIARSGSNPLGRANLIEQYLQGSFEYTTGLSLDAPRGDDPILWFLYEGRRGHCEFFATAMTMMLRSVGIPARLQVGYLGGEPDGDGGFTVRDSNAHAWVIAWTGAEWRIFDPTPAVGRPAIRSLPGAGSMTRVWTRFEGLWDRWVLTFSMFDQFDLLRATLGVVRRLGGPVALVAVLAALLALLSGARRRRATAGTGVVAVGGGRLGRAVARVTDAARRAGLVGSGELTPRAVGAAVARVGAAEAVAWLVAAHEQARYGGGPAPARREVRRHERAALHAVTDLGRRNGASPTR